MRRVVTGWILVGVCISSVWGTDGAATVDGCHRNDVGILHQATVFCKSLAALLAV